MFQTAHKSTATAGRTALALLALAAILLSLFSFARPAIANDTIVGAFDSVNTSGPSANECLGFDFGYKIDAGDLEAGTHTYTSTDGLFTVTLTYDTTAKSVAFSGASPAVSRFIVKGGNEGPDGGRTIANYTPPVTSGAPASPPGGAGVSHVTFCGFIPPSITVNKTGDSLSKVGDPVSYTVTITNTSTTRTAHKVSITDTLAGSLTSNAGCGASLAPLGACTINYTYTVPAGAPDPLLNTVTAVYSSQAAGAGGVATVSDGHSVELFQPAISVVKTGPETAEVGDEIQYTVTITNIGSVDSPNLVIDSVIDSLVGDLTDDVEAECGELVRNVACVFTYDYTIPDADPDPLLNTVTVHTHPSGFPNDIFASDGHSVDFEFGEIIVIKDDLTDSGEDFTFQATYDEGGFTLSDDGTNEGDEDRNESGLITAEEEHFITETLEGDWELVGLECVSEGDSTFEYDGETASVFLADGDTVICTFSNDLEAPELGSITIVKNAVPDAAQDFAFQTTGAGLVNFSLDDDADGTLPNSRTFEDLAAGAYSVTELATDGWTLTSITCSPGGTVDATNPRKANITLAAGADVTCAFVNTQNAVVPPVLGSITIVKNAVPDDAQDFAFTTSGAGLSSFSLDDDANATLSNQQNFTGLVAGSYSVTETATTGWTLTSITCTAGGTVDATDPRKANITIAGGANVTCVFVNTRQGSGTLGGTPTPSPTVRQQVLTSTGVPNTGTVPEAGLTTAAMIGVLMALGAATLLSANAARERRRR